MVSSLDQPADVLYEETEEREYLNSSFYSKIIFIAILGFHLIPIVLALVYTEGMFSIIENPIETSYFSLHSSIDTTFPELTPQSSEIHSYLIFSYSNDTCKSRKMHANYSLSYKYLDKPPIITTNNAQTISVSKPMFSKNGYTPLITFSRYSFTDISIFGYVDLKVPKYSNVSLLSLCSTFRFFDFKMILEISTISICFAFILSSITNQFIMEIPKREQYGIITSCIALFARVCEAIPFIFHGGNYLNVNTQILEIILSSLYDATSRIYFMFLFDKVSIRSVYSLHIPMILLIVLDFAYSIMEKIFNEIPNVNTLEVPNTLPIRQTFTLIYIIFYLSSLLKIWMANQLNSQKLILITILVSVIVLPHCIIQYVLPVSSQLMTTGAAFVASYTMKTNLVLLISYYCSLEYRETSRNILDTNQFYTQAIQSGI